MMLSPNVHTGIDVLRPAPCDFLYAAHVHNAVGGTPVCTPVAAQADYFVFTVKQHPEQCHAMS